MNPYRALPLLLLLLTPPALLPPVPASAAAVDLVGTWEQKGFQSPGDERIEPGHPATWTFRPDRTLDDGRDDGQKATWSLDGDRLEILYEAEVKTAQVGTVSLSPAGELAFDCRNELVEGRKRTPEGTPATLFFVRAGAAPAVADGPIEGGEPADAQPLAAYGQGGWIDGRDVNLRAGASSKSKALDRLKRNDGVDVLEEGPLDSVGAWGTKHWFKVRVRRTGAAGWVFGAFLKPIEGCSN